MIKTNKLTTFLSATAVLLSIFTFIASPSVQADSIVWVIDKSTGELVHTTDGAELVRFDPGIKAKYMCVDNEDQSVWVTDKKTLKKFSTTGVELGTLEGLKGVKAIACDSSTGGLWLATSKSLKKLDANLNEIGEYAIKVKRIVAQPTNGSVWVIGSKKLTNIGPEMNLLSSSAIKGVKAVAPHFADWSLWVATKKTLTKYDSDGNTVFEKELKGIRNIEPSDFDGSVWIGAKKTVMRLDANGAELLNLPVKGLKGISADATDGSVWWFTSKSVAKVSAVGNPDITLEMRLRALGVARGPALRALPDASTKSGQRPLEVTLITKGVDPNGIIDRYRWDFDGDGFYDYTATTAEDITHTYTTSNLYHTTLEVHNQRGSTATATVDINVRGSATALPNAFPTTGNAPLTVTFVPDADDPDSTIETYEWDFDGDGSYDTFDQVARNYQHTYPQANVDPNTGQVIPYHAALKVSNAIGDIDVATIDILVNQSPPEATGEADPSNGGVPLTVNFTGIGTDPDGTIALYEWDFDGDGTYDYSSPTTPDTAHTYNSQGTYVAVLRVTDNDGLTGTAPTDTTTVIVGQQGSPTAHAGAQISIETNLALLPGVTVNASSNYPGYPPERGIDGNLNTSWFTAAGDAANLGTSPYFEIVFPSDQFVIQINMRGNREYDTGYDFFRGRFEVFDANGVVLFTQDADLPGPDRDLDIDIPDIGGVRKVRFTSLDDESNEPGFAELEVIGYKAGVGLSGVAPLLINLIGTGTDPDGNIVLYEWDFEGDGTYDYSSPINGTTNHTYAGVGKFYPTLRVTDNDGLTGVDKIEITTSIEVNLSINDPDHTVDSTNGETIDVQTYYSTEVPVSVLIKDSEGNVVRKLVDNETLAGGTHNDAWDGRDDNGLIVNDGIYYAILEYTVNGEVKTVDYTHTTGGERYLPSRQSVRHDFSPYKDDFLDIHYSLNEASEVTLFVGILWGENRRVRTILNRAPRPAGNHVEYWDGLDDQEQIAHPPPGDALILGLWGYTLPDNAIFVTGGRPVITNISADPNYLDPSTTCGSEGKTTVSYDLSEDVATVELRVISLKSGKTVRTITQTNVSAGTNTIEWDGRNDNGELVDKQDFQLGLTATDAEGNKSLTRYALVRLFY